MLPGFKWRDFGLRAPKQYHTRVWDRLDYGRPVSEMTQLDYKSDPDVLKVFFFLFFEYILSKLVAAVDQSFFVIIDYNL